MDNWILKAPKTLVKEEQTETDIEPRQVKVKVTHAFVSNYDAQLYAGIIPARYPKTLGRFAVGVITEVGEECYGLKVNDNVYLRPTRACGRCVACKSGRAEDCADVQVAGKNFDGFFRDFVVCDSGDISVMPPTVDGLHGVFIETVALAENVYDHLNLAAGSKVAIFGGGFTGTIMAQVAQYHKYIPLLVDNNPLYLDRAKASGIYYTFAADDELAKNVIEATAGQMCDGAVYITSSRLNPSLPARLVAKKHAVVYAGFTSANFSIDVRDLLSRNVHCFTVSDGYGYTDTALNMMANNAISLDMFAKEIITDGDLGDLLENKLEGYASHNKLTILKMIL